MLLFLITLENIGKYRKSKYFNGLVEKGLQVGENTHILEGVFLDPSHCFLISIGNRCTLAPNVRIIAHDASMKQYLGVVKIAKVQIHDHCFIGDSSLILPGVSIGPYTVIGSGSVVTRDIPGHSIAAGNPAKIICSMDEFIKKHKEGKMHHRCFAESRFEITGLSDEDKGEMLPVLKKRLRICKMMGETIRVMQITQDLDIGGLQRVVVDLALNINKDHFDVSACVLREMP